MKMGCESVLPGKSGMPPFDSTRLFIGAVSGDPNGADPAVDVECNERLYGSEAEIQAEPPPGLDLSPPIHISSQQFSAK
jgi:hypothetical protein